MRQYLHMEFEMAWLPATWFPDPPAVNFPCFWHVDEIYHRLTFVTHGDKEMLDICKSLLPNYSYSGASGILLGQPHLSLPMCATISSVFLPANWRRRLILDAGSCSKDISRSPECSGVSGRWLNVIWCEFFFIVRPTSLCKCRNSAAVRKTTANEMWN